jgi:hypothetical protein
MISSFTYTQNNSYTITTVTLTDGSTQTIVRPKGK